VRWTPLLLIVSGHVSACVCGRYPSVKEAWEKSPAVFVGYVESVDTESLIGRLLGIRTDQSWTLAQIATVRADEPFKGSHKGQVFVLRQPGNDCAPKFRERQRVLFYLNPSSSPNSWEALGCHRTRALETAADDLLFLRALPGSAGKNRFGGEVVLYENSVSEGFRRLRVLPGTHVHFRSKNQAVGVVTNSDGAYESYGLRPDSYQITIDVPQGLRILFPVIAGGEGRRDRLKDLDATEPVVEIGSTSAADVDFVLVADGQISGRVLDTDGKPVKDVCVQLKPAVGEASSYFYISKCSEADGSYRLKDISAGEYIITAKPWRGGRPSGSTLFYPGTEDRKHAAVVRIGAGEHLDGFDIRMTK
jgi:hypothetical protein